MPVSEILKKKRKEKHWTQAELAEKSGVSQQAISFIESERNTPSEGTLRLLAKALGCPISELVDEIHEITGLTFDERRLIDLFRKLNDEGKTFVFQSALMAQNTYRNDSMGESDSVSGKIG